MMYKTEEVVGSCGPGRRVGSPMRLIVEILLIHVVALSGQNPRQQPCV